MTATDPTAPAELTEQEAPRWLHCRHGADPDTDSVGCRGRSVDPHTSCLAHLDDDARDAYLAGLSPGADIDHRSTTFTADLLGALLDAVQDTDTESPRFGKVRFDGANFTEGAWFTNTTFTGHADFGEARFTGETWFWGAKFIEEAVFTGARFAGDAAFRQAIFTGYAWFGETTFTGNAGFSDARFMAGARFGDARFMENAGFGDARFMENAGFSEAKFAGEAWFSEAKFTGEAWFSEAKFTGYTDFREARFAENAAFSASKFLGGAEFGQATFTKDATFEKAAFNGGASFWEATFTGGISFREAAFAEGANFHGVPFTEDTSFLGTTFNGNADFDEAMFEGSVHLGPFVCTKTVSFAGAVFSEPATLEMAAGELDCRRTRWTSTAALRLRHSVVDLSDAVLEFPVSLSAHPTPFTPLGDKPLGERTLEGPVEVASLRGVDAAHLTLSDVDLKACRFAGTIHLDQLRLEGVCTFDPAPPGLHWRGVRPVRWTPRQTLAEEHHLRADYGDTGWTPAPGGVSVLQPAALAPIYRQLRKILEDGKHEPGAADFYYGEMEMRRRTPKVPRGEKVLLAAYWALSGYGLRASRAVSWLLLAMIATVGAMMLWGLPKDDPKPESTLRVDGGQVKLITDTPKPVNPDGALEQRMS